MSSDEKPLTLVRKDGSLSKVRPPFEPGNTAHLTHGARSERAIAEKAEQVRSELLDHCPWLADDHFAPAVDLYLRACTRERLLHEHICKVSAEKGPGALPVRVWEGSTAASRLAWQLGDQLGLSPAGHARLKVLAGAAISTEASIADLAERGRAIREAAAKQVVAEAIEEPEL